MFVGETVHTGDSRHQDKHTVDGFVDRDTFQYRRVCEAVADVVPHQIDI